LQASSTLIGSVSLVRSVLVLADWAGRASARAVAELLRSMRLAAVPRRGMWPIMFVVLSNG
jgi:hypothetical protein